MSRPETIKLVRISRKQHLSDLRTRLAQTPKWKFLERATLKRIIKVLTPKETND